MNSATSEQQAKIDKMSYKDIKADQKRAKEQMKLNKEKLARGEKLTKEEEYGALTQQQLLYRIGREKSMGKFGFYRMFRLYVC